MSTPLCLLRVWLGLFALSIDFQSLHYYYYCIVACNFSHASDVALEMAVSLMAGLFRLKYLNSLMTIKFVTCILCPQRMSSADFSDPPTFYQHINKHIHTLISILYIHIYTVLVHVPQHIQYINKHICTYTYILLIATLRPLSASQRS